MSRLSHMMTTVVALLALIFPQPALTAPKKKKKQMRVLSGYDLKGVIGDTVMINKGKKNFFLRKGEKLEGRYTLVEIDSDQLKLEGRNRSIVMIAADAFSGPKGGGRSRGGVARRGGRERSEQGQDFNDGGTRSYSSGGSSGSSASYGSSSRSSQSSSRSSYRSSGRSSNSRHVSRSSKRATRSTAKKRSRKSRRVSKNRTRSTNKGLSTAPSANSVKPKTPLPKQAKAPPPKPRSAPTKSPSTRSTNPNSQTNGAAMGLISYETSSGSQVAAVGYTVCKNLVISSKSAMDQALDFGAFPLTYSASSGNPEHQLYPILPPEDYEANIAAFTTKSEINGEFIQLARSLDRPVPSTEVKTLSKDGSKAKRNLSGSFIETSWNHLKMAEENAEAILPGSGLFDNDHLVAILDNSTVENETVLNFNTLQNEANDYYSDWLRQLKREYCITPDLEGVENSYEQFRPFSLSIGESDPSVITALVESEDGGIRCRYMLSPMTGELEAVKSSSCASKSIPTESILTVTTIPSNFEVNWNCLGTTPEGEGIFSEKSGSQITFSATSHLKSLHCQIRLDP